MLGKEIIKYIIENNLENKELNLMGGKCCSCDNRFKCNVCMEDECKQNNDMFFEDKW